MLDKEGFNLWSGDYDGAVRSACEQNRYPFAGYDEVLGRIYHAVTRKESPAVLDLGFGTGTLTAKLYEAGCEVYGQDFSENMLITAQAKMPDARLYQRDFLHGLAEPLLRQKFDYILATYSLHHLPDDRKTGFLRMLQRQLKEGGRILIGDIAFETRTDLEDCARNVGEEWDSEEYYHVAEELRRDFPELEFTPVSFCAGILTIPE